MTPAGWIFMTVSWTLIIGLCAFCFRKLFEQHRRRSHR